MAGVADITLEGIPRGCNNGGQTHFIDSCVKFENGENIVECKKPTQAGHHNAVWKAGSWRDKKPKYSSDKKIRKSKRKLPN